MLHHVKCRSIGTSKGVIIPSDLLKSAKININDILDIDYSSQDNAIIIKKAKVELRAGWGESFKKLSLAEGDNLLIDDVFEDEFTDDSI